MTPDNNTPLETWGRAALEQNRRWLTAFTLSQTGSPQDAEDLVQTVFSRAIKYQTSYDGSRQLGAWLRGIARNVLREYWRKQKRLPVFVEEEALRELQAAAEADAPNWMQPDAESDRIVALRECMMRLAERIRKVVRLKYRALLPSAEIGARLGMTRAAVDMGLSRARRVLADCVERRLGGLSHGA